MHWRSNTTGLAILAERQPVSCLQCHGMIGTTRIYHVQVLSRDIRSIHQRSRQPSRVPAGGTPPKCPPGQENIAAVAAAAAAAAAVLDPQGAAAGSCLETRLPERSPLAQGHTSLEHPMTPSHCRDTATIGTSAPEQSNSVKVPQGGSAPCSVYHVVLDGIDVVYRVRGEDGVMEVLSASRATK
jgi:hypothetical protein